MGNRGGIKGLRHAQNLRAADKAMAMGRQHDLLPAPSRVTCMCKAVPPPPVLGNLGNRFPGEVRKGQEGHQKGPGGRPYRWGEAWCDRQQPAGLQQAARRCECTWRNLWSLVWGEENETKNGQIFVLGSASQTKDQRFFCLFTAENLWSLVKK